MNCGIFVLKCLLLTFLYLSFLSLDILSELSKQFSLLLKNDSSDSGTTLEAIFMHFLDMMEKYST